MEKIAVQDKYGSKGTCFGCGPKNPKGLQIKSYWEGEYCITRFKPRPEHQAFEGAVNGGIIGTLFDCHMNWTGASYMYQKNPDKPFPSTVTAKYCVRFKKPTPLNTELLVKAWPVSLEGNKVKVEAELIANGEVTATANGTFVAVKEGHPAYQRW